MDQANPIASESQSDASTLSRLESFLSSEDDQQVQDNDTAAQVEDANVNEDDGSQQEEEVNVQLSDVAKLLGADESALDVSDDGQILVKTKIDGQEGKVPFQELVKSYQLQGHVDRQVREAAEQRKAIESQTAILNQQMQIQQALADDLGTAKAIELELAQYASVDWDRWYDSAADQAAKYAHRQNELQQQYNKVVGNINAKHQSLLQQSEQLKQASSIQERQALFDKLPEWRDEAKYEEGKKQLGKFLSDLKVSNSTFSAIDANHELLLMARDAMLYRQSQSNVKATEKNVRAAPKIIKPGTSQPANTSNIQKLHAAVKNTGSRQSVAEYLMATGRV